LKFLIDECLHTSLTDVAHEEGHEAYHVVWRGWAGLKDHQLRAAATQEGLVLITNNARDFRKLMEAIELHAGLIVIVPNVPPAMQRELFKRVLRELANLPDMVNKVIEVDLDEIRFYELPKIVIELNTFRTILKTGCGKTIF
jgi:predicted nuclease of predicted toxin-antitoxin system